MNYEKARTEFEEAVSKLMEEAQHYADHPKCNELVLQAKEQRINKLMRFLKIAESYMSQLEMENMQFAKEISDLNERIERSEHFETVVHYLVTFPLCNNFTILNVKNEHELKLYHEKFNDHQRQYRVYPQISLKEKRFNKALLSTNFSLAAFESNKYNHT